MLKKNKEIYNFSDQDLEKNLKNSKEDLIKLKTNHGINPLENPMEIRQLRRKIARFHTEIAKRALTNDKK
jgi:large subunit ribosomal protein L29